MSKHILKKNNLSMLSIAAFAFCAIIHPVLAKQIWITGHVYNAATGQAMEGANVVILETPMGASTDSSGEYHIFVPLPGEYTIAISFVGFETVNKSVNISDEETIVLDFTLKESIITVEGICVESARAGIMVTNRMTVIDIEKFTEATRVHRLEEILGRMAGIDIYRTSTVVNPSQLVSMRGCNDMRFVIAVDGRAWSSPSHEDCPIDWSALTTGGIEKIEIIRGGGTVLYDGAMGGIINIVKKKGTTGRGFIRPKINARMGMEAFRSLTANMATRGGIGSLGYSFSGGLDLSEGYLRNEYGEGYDLSGNLDYPLSFVKGHVSLSLKHHSTEMGYPVINDPGRDDYDPDYPIVFEEGDLIRKWNDNVYPGGTSYRNKTMNFIDLVYKQPVSRALITLNLFGNMGHDTTYEYLYSLVAVVDSLTGDTTIVPVLGQSAAVSNEYTYGVSCRVKVSNIDLHTFTFGADYRNLGTFPIEEGTIMGIHIEESEAIPDWYRLVGIFGEDQFKATSAINLTFGLRWSYLDEWTMPTYENPTTGDSGRVHFYYNALLPKFSASYSFPDSTIIYSSVNRDWHVPNC